MRGDEQKARCDRFEEEALLRLEQGLPLDGHFDTCPDCQEARAAYGRLREEIARAGAGEEPPPGWESRVRQGVGRRRLRRRRWAWTLGPALAAALVALLVLTFPRQEAVPSLRLEILAGAVVRRGEEAHPGDRLTLQASTGGARFAELRVYRDDRQIVLRCSEEPPCEHEGGMLRATIELPARGTYQALLLLSPDPLPAPVSGLDQDTAAALDAGAEAILAGQVTVR